MPDLVLGFARRQAVRPPPLRIACVLAILIVFGERIVARAVTTVLSEMRFYLAHRAKPCNRFSLADISQTGTRAAITWAPMLLS